MRKRLLGKVYKITSINNRSRKKSERQKLGKLDEQESTKEVIIDEMEEEKVK